MIVDRQFDADNQLEYYYDPFGVVGDKVLVNGTYQPYLNVADRKYRLRLLNGANARIYTLTLSTGEAFTQIGTESGLLPAPVTRTAMEMGPGERFDVIVDFAGKQGEDVYLMDAQQAVTSPEIPGDRPRRRFHRDSSEPASSAGHRRAYSDAELQFRLHFRPLDN